MASDDVALIFRAKGDTDLARRAFSDLKGSITKDVAEIESKGAASFQNLAQSMLQGQGAAGALASSFPGIGTAIAGVTVAIGAAVAITVGLTEKLFSLAESAAAFGGSLKDAIDKTGASAESIQVFKFAAEQSGSSLEKISGSVAKFSTLLGQAKEGNDRAEATLKKYGITATDTDTALAQAVKTIANMTDTTEQSAAAAALFKDRTGEILPVIKQMNGDIPAVIKQLQDMGLMMSGKDVEAADALDDQLKTLKDQFSGVARTIGVELIPVFTDLARDVSGWLKSNKGELRSWADTIATTVRGAVTSIYLAKDAFTALGKAINGDYIGAGVALTAGSTASMIETMAKNRLRDLQGDHQQAAPRTYGGDDTGDADAKKAAEEAKKSRDDAFKRDLAAQKDHIQIRLEQEREGFKTAQDLLDESFKSKAISEETYRKNSEAAREKWRTESHRLLIEQEQLDTRNATAAEKQNIADKRVEAERAIGSAIARERNAVNQTITAQQKAAGEEQIKLARQAYDEDVARFESTQNKKRALALQYAKEDGTSQEDLARISEAYDDRILAHKLEAAQTYRDQLNADTDAYNTAQLAVERLEDQIEQSRAEHAGNEHDRRQREIDDEQRVRDEKNKSWHDYIEQLEQKRDIENQQQADKAAQDMENNRTSNSGVGGGIASSLGIRLPSLLDDKGQLKKQADYIKDVYSDVADMAGRAIGSMIDGLSNLMTQWIITGKFSGKAALAMVAQIALSLAMQAGIKAIFELAEGYAALAVTWGVPNPASIAHFAAASIYGTIAGISAGVGVAAAVGARAMGAGDTFKRESAGAFGSAGSGAGSKNGGSVYSSQPDQTVTNGRNTPALSGDIRIHITMDADGIGKVLRRDVQTNGPISNLIGDVAAAKA